MSAPLSPERARQLIAVEDLLLEHRRRTNREGWQAADRWLADRAVAYQERLAVLEARVIEARDELKEEYGQLCAYGTPKYDHGAGYAAALERVGKMFAAILKGDDQ